MKENNDMLFYNLLMNDDVIQEIINTYVELDKARIENGNCNNSHHWKVILTKDGKVDYGYFTNYSTRMDIYEGKAIQIATLDDNAEVKYEDMDMENLKDYWDFREAMQFAYMDEVLEEYEDDMENMTDEQKTEYAIQMIDELYVTWDEYYEYNWTGYNNEVIRAWREQCEWYSEDEILDKIECTRMMLENRIDREN